MANPMKVSSGRNASAAAIARGLGWFSIGLGLAEILMPRRVGRMSGLHGRETLLRAYGLREVANGVGILAAKTPKNRAPWMWARVGGDALDITTAASRLRTPAQPNGRVLVTLLALAGVTLFDIACAAEQTERARRQSRPARDYSDRSGFPRAPDAMRGTARESAVQRLPRKSEPAQPRLNS